MKDQIFYWLSRDVIPLWTNRGVDHERGGFVDNLSLNGTPRKDPRRAMVQARQIYSYRVAIEMGVIDRNLGVPIVELATTTLIRRYSHSSGAFLHTCEEDGKIVKETPELYTQAFALFALANAFALVPKNEWKARAIGLVQYLERERRVPAGGFTEFGPNKEILYVSNPHMHLFEAALAWREIDDDPIWRRLSDSLANLCTTSFLDSATGLLVEHFDESWRPLREGERFFFEPGHQYEWSWLFGRYQKMSGRDMTEVRRRLFERGEAHGIDNVRRVVFDQVWSDYEPKLKSSRFWPQTERIKAAAQLERDGLLAPGVGRAAATACMQVLFKYLQTEVRGLWYDVMDEKGDLHAFGDKVVKASSLYHIIGAMDEFTRSIH